MSSRGTQVWGSVALHTEPIVIKGTNNTLNFQVDGVEYEASIPQGTYATRLELFTSELIEPVNEALRHAQSPSSPDWAATARTSIFACLCLSIPTHRMSMLSMALAEARET
ncbi:hypothetical protein [Paenibacillus dendritiformis]|uniref:hypothetical protein n=1 Tax=Paenibacillus dendritiformis TaxID=130049 RepID=UPI00387E20A9